MNAELENRIAELENTTGDFGYRIEQLEQDTSLEEQIERLQKEVDECEDRIRELEL